jgi:hypothetical protein
MNILEEKMIQVAAFGVMKKIISISVPDPINFKPEEKLNALSLDHFVLSFLSLAVGLCLALAAFIYENIKHKRANKNTA